MQVDEIMLQAKFPDFGPTDPKVAEWRTPAPQPPSIVALCRDQAHAVALSLDFARSRFGYHNKDVAGLVGVHASVVSKWRKGAVPVPESRRLWFARATGCNLLIQHVEDVEARKKATGQMTQNERDRMIVALMTGAVA